MSGQTSENYKALDVGEIPHVGQCRAQPVAVRTRAWVMAVREPSLKKRQEKIPGLFQRSKNVQIYNPISFTLPRHPI